MEPLTIEILDRFGKIKERHRIDSFPCKIGRDYSNNIILDDPYISPAHIILKQQDGQCTLEDNNSKNGVFSLHPFQKQQSINIINNSRVRIGHTDIRFRYADHKIKETIQERDKPSQISMLLSNAFILPIVWLLFSAAFMLNSYLEAISPITFQKLLSETFPLLIFMALWAMAWSIVSKVVTHRFYFAFHAIWITCLTLVSTVLDNLADYIEFSFSFSGASYFLGLIFSFLITATLLYGHLHYSTTFSAKKSKLVSFVASLTIIAIIEIFGLLNSDGFSNTPKYSSIIKPSVFLLSRKSSIDGFFSNVQNIKSSIDKDLIRQTNETN